MDAVVYDDPGAPEVLRVVEVSDPVCAPDGIVVRLEAVAIEGGDIVRRASERPSHPKFILGYGAVGEIVEIGRDVTRLRVGQRVATMGMDGAYAQLRAVHADVACAVPGALEAGTAAAMTIAFATAHRCLFAAGRLVAGETVLLQAAAGGLGVAAVQLASRAGATVIAIASGTSRSERLQDLGAAHVIDRRKDDVVEVIRTLTGRRGVDLAIDPVGGTSLQRSIAALRPEGRLVFVGNAAREAMTVDVWPALQSNNILAGVFMGTRFADVDTHETLQDMFAEAAAGRLRAIEARRFNLFEAAAAHRYIESNAILGRVILEI